MSTTEARGTAGLEWQPESQALTIGEVDVHDDAALAAWHEVVVAVEEHELGEHAAYWMLPELRVALREPRKDRRNVLFSAVLDGSVVAAGSVGLPLLDNLSAADIEVLVLPEHRRRGIGSALLSHLEAFAQQQGRTRFDAMLGFPYDAGPDGAGTPGVEFGKAHGYTFGLGDVQRELPLPVDDALLGELADEAAPYHRDYELRLWVGPVPDDIVQSWLELSATLITEAPTGDNEYEEEAVDVEAFRMSEAMQAKQGRTRFHCAALDRDGRVVAYTDLVLSVHDPKWVHQWGTLVHREHRGHRLGLAVKAANLRALQASDIDLTGRRLVTWNAEVNDHMIGINERLGFRPTARGGELQKKIG